MFFQQFLECLCVGSCAYAQIERAHPIRVHSIHVGLCIQEHLGYRGRSTHWTAKQRTAPIVTRLQFNIRAVRNQDVRDLVVAAEHSVVEGREPSGVRGVQVGAGFDLLDHFCLLYTSDAADDLLCVDLGGRRIFKKKIDTSQ
eukprot:TRINITY_DN16123_c0_g1_i1.p1 TRINITY_DN16123_c0_g1~~TRINITY_DN16123_c0_g1_i1.p1  ORF type:complete len:142 (-),score=32.37 TRINITY_DN16123_c0_g1_i1:2-427(-)